MGQYYRVVLGDKFGLDCKVFDRSVDGEYTLAKLMEHSWWLNPFCNSFAENIYNEERRVCWVGDYADEDGDFDFKFSSAVYVPNESEVWGETVNLHGCQSSAFFLDHKFLLNHDTKEFIDLDDYKEKSEDKHGWTIHPLPLMTAVGNDRGGGDFHKGNIGYEFVGIWAWHLISISDEVSKNCKKFDVVMSDNKNSSLYNSASSRTKTSASCTCSDCGTFISQKVADYSKSKFGKYLCYDCQHSQEKVA